MHHTLKTWPEYFALSWAGLKPFEIRINDRSFLNGDSIALVEYNPAYELYTGRVIRGYVESVLVDSIGVEKGFVILLIRETERNTYSMMSKKEEQKP